jgi:BRCA1-associated protein
LRFIRCSGRNADSSTSRYVHRLIQNRSDGKLVELPSATSLTTSTRVPSGINFDRFNATALAKGFGPTASDEKKMAQLEDITLEYSYLVSEQLEQQKQLHDAEMRNLSRQLKEEVYPGRGCAEVAGEQDVTRTGAGQGSGGVQI